jgi:hypothetical protein
VQLPQTAIDLAKRKGFRIKKDRENKAKARERKLNLEVKQEWVPPSLRLDQNILKMGSRRYSDKDKDPIPSDNVFFVEQFKQLSYSFEDAISLHREVLHPTIMNQSNALVKARIELNMRLKKKSRHLPPFFSIYTHPHYYDFSRLRRLVAVCPNEEIAEQARQEGAILAGGADVIKMLKERKFTEIDFDFIICHTDMLIPLADARGVLKDHFPSKQLGNFGGDIPKLVRKFMDGVHYESIRDRFEPEYGWVEQHFGRLDMPIEQLKTNFVALLNEIHKYKPAETERKLHRSNDFTVL